MKWVENLKVFFQSEERFSVNFQTNPLSVRKMKWLNEPKKKKMKDRSLFVEPEGKTDWWQRTYYEYAHDSAPFLYYTTTRNFVMEVRADYTPANRFDQAGLAVRIDSKNWIKVSVEFDPESEPKLVAVVTNHGFSDASVQELSEPVRSARFRITKTGQDFLIEAALLNEWQMIRLAHLHNDAQEIRCGLFAAAPVEEGFKVKFDGFKLWEV